MALDVCPARYLLLPLLLAACTALAACGERAQRSEGAPSAASREAGDADVLAEAEEALRRAEEAQLAADEALALAREAREASERMERREHERRSRELVVTGGSPLDPARPQPPEGLVLDGVVVSFDASTGVVVLSLGAASGIRQGYRLTISRGDRYVGLVEIDGVEAERSRGRSIESLQKHAPQPGDRVQHL